MDIHSSECISVRERFIEALVSGWGCLGKLGDYWGSPSQFTMDMIWELIARFSEKAESLRAMLKKLKEENGLRGSLK
ncbi:MAG: hypothetical protein ACKVGW_12250 [Verrucomicrobiia bacterium]|jgi:hypothetical protein